MKTMYFLFALALPFLSLAQAPKHKQEFTSEQRIKLHAKKLQYPVHILSKRYDIDTISDLQKLLSDQNTPSLLKQRILPYA